MDQWTNTNYIEHVRERQAALQKEAKRQQLLRDLPDTPKRFTLFRKVVLVTGNLLIATGLWLKHHAAPAQSQGHRPTMAGRLS